MTAARTVRAGVLLSAWLLCGVAQGAELRLRNCATLSESMLREQLELELSTLSLQHVDVQLSLRCEGTKALVELTHAGEAREPALVTVELGDTERGARERLLALSLSELVAQQDRAPRRAATVTPKVEPLPPPKERPAVPARSRVALDLAATGAKHGDPSALLWGGALGARFGFSPHWGMALESHIERGSSNVTRATLRWSLLSAFVGIAARTELGACELSAALGARGGSLTWTATANAPLAGRSLTAAWGGVALPLRVALNVGSKVRPFVGGELGYVLLPARGSVSDGSVLVTERALWLGASLGGALPL